MKMREVPNGLERIEHIHLSSYLIPGIENLNVDDEVTLHLKVKVLKVGREVYDETEKEKPLEADLEVQEGKVVSVQEEIGNAESMKELDKAVSPLQKKLAE